MATQVVFKVDPAVKKAAMRRAKREGIPFASVLKLATKAFADGKFDIGLHVEEKFNKKTAREIRAALKDIENNRNLSPRFSNVEDAIKWLNRG